MTSITAPAPGTTRVQLTIWLDLAVEKITPEIQSALANLADVMAVQAEDGLYTLGSPDAEGDVPNECLADIEQVQVADVCEAAR